MFNLEQSIAEWRRQMLAAGLKTPTPLNELESHLREDVRRLISEGQPENDAFQLAVSRLGNAGPLRTEFSKLKRPACWPVKIGFWIYVIAMVLTAALLSRALMAGRWNLLIYAHVVSITAGYCAAFLVGSFGIFYVCYRFMHALSPVRQKSLQDAVSLLSRLGGGFVIAGIILSLFVSKQLFGVYWGWDLKEIGGLCVLLWLIALAAMHRFGPSSNRITMLLCIGGNFVVSLAWFGPFMLVHGTSRYWPLAIFLGLNLIFLVIGMAPLRERAEL